MALLAVALFFGCKEESILQEVEKELPHEPEVIVLDDVLNYRLASAPVYGDQGFGVVDRDSNIAIYYISSDSIICRPEGGAQGTIFSDSAFAATFVEFDGEFLTAAAFFFYNGEFIQLYQEDSEGPCDFQLPQITVDYVDEERIEGTLRGLAYQISGIVDSGSVECDQYKNLGILEADFSVSLEECN